MSPGERPALSVTRYLRADEQVVPFQGRPELDELLTWCGADGRVRVRLVTGDGGAGKTRLALRLCKDLAAQGWRSLWVHPGREAYAAEAVRKLGPCVLVVDYAEIRDSLRSMLSEAEQILMAQRRHARQVARPKATQLRRAMQAAHATIGYGYRPWRVLWLLAALLVLVALPPGLPQSKPRCGQRTATAPSTPPPVS